MGEPDQPRKIDLSREGRALGEALNFLHAAIDDVEGGHETAQEFILDLLQAEICAKDVANRIAEMRIAYGKRLEAGRRGDEMREKLARGEEPEGVAGHEAPRVRTRAEGAGVPVVHEPTITLAGNTVGCQECVDSVGFAHAPHCVSAEKET